MSKFRNNLRKIPLIKTIASLEVTVICLFLLFILTLWGTVAQVNSGLYASQQRYFYSWFFLIWGGIPFPGGRLVLWALFLNLLGAASIRLVYRWERAGIIITHFGLMTFFVAAFVTFHCVEESYVNLKEGQASNLSSSYHDWEISAWKDKGTSHEAAFKKEVVSFSGNDFQPGHVLDFAPLGLSLIVKEYFPHCSPHIERSRKETINILNASDINLLKPLKPDRDPAKNSPGGIFRIQDDSEDGPDIYLFGGEINPTPVPVGKDIYYVTIRQKRFMLPLTLKLIDFKMDHHPGTSLARSYQSKVEIVSHDVGREALISMNNPLRYEDYTFYQSSYQIEKTGEEYSTLAVVKNTGRLLPYIATFVTFLGLAILCLTMAFSKKIPLGINHQNAKLESRREHDKQKKHKF